MKTISKSNSNFLFNLKNVWFALQLLIVSVSLPVMSFVQVSHADNAVNSKQTEKVNNNSLTQDPSARQHAEKTVVLPG